MGIYYTNIIYYGNIMRNSFYEENIKNTKIPEEITLWKLNSDRFILFSKRLVVDDDVENERLVPDSFSKQNIMQLNNIKEDFFYDDLYTDELKKFTNNEPKFYILCYQSCTLDMDSEVKVLYNIVVI